MSAAARLRSAGRRLAHGVAPTAIDSVSDVPQLRATVDKLQAEVKSLRGEVRALRAEVQETRRLHQRVAELTDIVADVLVAAADKDDPRIRRALDDFAAGSF